MEEAGRGRKYEGWLENGRCTLPIKVECWCRSDCCWVEVNLATLTCWDTTTFQTLVALSQPIHMLFQSQPIHLSRNITLSPFIHTSTTFVLLSEYLLPPPLWLSHPPRPILSSCDFKRSSFSRSTSCRLTLAATYAHCSLSQLFTNSHPFYLYFCIYIETLHQPNVTLISSKFSMFLLAIEK